MLTMYSVSSGDDDTASAKLIIIFFHRGLLYSLSPSVIVCYSLPLHSAPLPHFSPMASVCSFSVDTKPSAFFFFFNFPIFSFSFFVLCNSQSVLLQF